MSAPKIFVVFGATGVQGGSVIKSILGDPRTAKEFKIRGITRDPSKPRAQELVKQGVEAVEVCVSGSRFLSVRVMVMSPPSHGFLVWVVVWLERKREEI